MNADLHVLYQETILDHNKHPRNFRAIEGGLHAEGYNPLCGDRLVVYLCVEHDRIVDAAFEGSCCAIAKASASLMTDRVKGLTLEETEALAARFSRLLTAKNDAPLDDIGTLSVLAGVRHFPVRISCATLPWHALRAAAQLREAVVSTE